MKGGFQMAKSWERIKSELAEPFSSEDVEWRLQNVSKDKTKGLAVAYVTARAIQNRLDEVVGPENWQDEYISWHGGSTLKEASQLCVIHIFDKEKNLWISKTDGAENTDIEPVKGGLSDAYKRAAVKWGIGRYLYDMEAAWVDVDPGYPKVIPNKELPKLKKIHDAHVKKLKEGQPQDSPSKEMPAALPSAQKPPASKPLPQYVVRKTEKHRFSHVVHQVIDLEQENGDVITVFLSDVNQEVRPGIILQNVKIGAHEGKQDAKKIFYTLDEYQIAA